MEESEIAELFAKASTLDESKQGFLTTGEWTARKSQSGKINFKRRAVGLCGSESIKTLDEMVQLLKDTNIASSVDEGRQLVPKLVGARVGYGSCKVMTFEEVKDHNGNRAYRISAYSYDSGI